MEEKNKKLSPKSDKDKFFDSNIVVSSTESTGLMPTLPLSEHEVDSYNEIYDIPQTKVKADNGPQISDSYANAQTRENGRENHLDYNTRS